MFCDLGWQGRNWAGLLFIFMAGVTQIRRHSWDVFIMSVAYIELLL